MSNDLHVQEFTRQYERGREAVLRAVSRFREGVHFLRTEEGKPTLMDAGAALLRDALGLYPDGDRIVDLRQEGEHVRVTITVVLYDRVTGRPRASGIGSASSRELLLPGRRLAGELDPGNVACKLARKRAEVDAMLGIPAVCEQFTQDLGLAPVIDPETGEVHEAPAPPGDRTGQPASAEGAADGMTVSTAAEAPQEAAPAAPKAAPSRPAAPARRPSPEEMAAQRRALAIAHQADRRNPYGWIARVLGIPTEGVSPAVALLRWLDQGHSWQEVAARLQEAAAEQGR
jgi:hypothetical protein